MKGIKIFQKSLYQKLILRLLIFLILPFMAVTMVLYGKIIADGEKNYLANVELLTERANTLREKHLENIYRVANRISSNSTLAGFFLTGYTSKNLEYYVSKIEQMVSGGLSYDNTYIPKLYLANQTIPRGFQLIYHLSDINKAHPVAEFLSSEQTELWVTPPAAGEYSTALFTPFKENYTYLRKITVDGKLVFLLTLSVHQSEMNSFIEQGHESMLYVNNQVLEDRNRMIVNCSAYPLDTAASAEETDASLALLEQKGYTIQCMEFPNFPQKLIYIIEPNSQRKYIMFGVVLSFVIFVAIISVVVVFIRKLFHSIFRCIKSFDDSIKNDFSTRLSVEGEDEISKIEIAFNALIDKIQELLALSAQQSSIAKESQLKALQQQINPHFMYNTLEVFAYKMELYQHYEEADAMVSFANMLRYNTVSNDKYATIGEELEQVRNYLRIQMVKYEKVEFQAVVPPELLDQEIIRFILQPLIENSFTHGYCGKPLRILLSCVDLGGQILFEICDNGHGIPNEELARINLSLSDGQADNSSGIGLKNISSRLQLFYSESYKLRLDSKENDWTMVTFQIPK